MLRRSSGNSDDGEFGGRHDGHFHVTSFWRDSCNFVVETIFPDCVCVQLVKRG